MSAGEQVGGSEMGSSRPIQWTRVRVVNWHPDTGVGFGEVIDSADPAVKAGLKVYVPGKERMRTDNAPLTDGMIVRVARVKFYTQAYLEARASEGKTLRPVCRKWNVDQRCVDNIDDAQIEAIAENASLVAPPGDDGKFAAAGAEAEGAIGQAWVGTQSGETTIAATLAGNTAGDSLPPTTTKPKPKAMGWVAADPEVGSETLD